MNALKEFGYTEFDVSAVKIDIKRTWEENILELAQVISTLASTGLFSEKYLIEKMPDGEYEIEVAQKQKERANKTEEQTSAVGLDNTYIGDFATLMRNYGNANDVA